MQVINKEREEEKVSFSTVFEFKKKIYNDNLLF